MTPKPQSLKTKDATYLLKVSSRSAACFVSWPKLIEPLPGTCSCGKGKRGHAQAQAGF